MKKKRKPVVDAEVVAAVVVKCVELKAAVCQLVNDLNRFRTAGLSAGHCIRPLPGKIKSIKVFPKVICGENEKTS